MKTNEHDTQVAFFQWCYLIRKMYPELEFAFAIPNGGYRPIGTAKRMKAEGERAGVLDVFLPAPRGRYHGLWIEFKNGRNRLTPNQEKFARYCEREGYYVAVCYTWTAAKSIVEGYLAPAR